MRFRVTPDGECRITPVGLESRSAATSFVGSAYSLQLEARLRVLPSFAINGRTRLQFSVGLTAASWVFLVLSWLPLPAFGITFLVQGRAGVLPFVVLAWGCAVTIMGLARARALVVRGWPTLLAEAQRIATDALYVPAA